MAPVHQWAHVTDPGPMKWNGIKGHVQSRDTAKRSPPSAGTRRSPKPPAIAFGLVFLVGHALQRGPGCATRPCRQRSSAASQRVGLLSQALGLPDTGVGGVGERDRNPCMWPIRGS